MGLFGDLGGWDGLEALAGWFGRGGRLNDAGWSDSDRTRLMGVWTVDEDELMLGEPRSAGVYLFGYSQFKSLSGGRSGVLQL